MKNWINSAISIVAVIIAIVAMAKALLRIKKEETCFFDMENMLFVENHEKKSE